MSWEEGYKAKLRDFMARKGIPAAVDRDTDWEQDRVSVYGWISEDWWHVRRGACSWVVPEGSRLEEHTYSQFADTLSGNKDEVGVEVYPVHCACGEKTDVTLRYVGSLGDVLDDVLGVNHDEGIDL